MQPKGIVVWVVRRQKRHPSALDLRSMIVTLPPCTFRCRGGPRCGRGPGTLPAIGSKSGASKYEGAGADLQHRHRTLVLPWGGNQKWLIPATYRHTHTY